MPLFPKIASPCPYKSDLAAIMDGDHCRMCDRQVFDLTAMSDGERRAFLATCTDGACVSYSIPLKGVARAAMVAAAIAAPGAAAARPAPRIAPPMMVVAGGIPPAPQVQLVPVPPVVDREEDLSRLYEEPAKTPPPAAKPPPKR